ncbi:hypothetical protein D1BOALGB6SA_9273 [Olavius sp. associated proteobacterium Delta 1]|nr:hypothetical protein D1BOALGB6SA_9273 [Olavius sp. associated proteobacterium Delta 1]
MKKIITLLIISAVASAFCFALVSVAQAGPNDPVTESWLKYNLVNKNRPYSCLKF